MGPSYPARGIPGGGILGSREDFLEIVKQAVEQGAYSGWSMRIQERVAVGGRWHDKYILELKDGACNVYMVRAEETSDSWSERMMKEIEELVPLDPEQEE